MKDRKPTDIHPVSAALRFIPVTTRLPLKFGRETVVDVTWARVCLKVADARGRAAEGWGEAPLCAQWAWPAELPYEERHGAMKEFTQSLVTVWGNLAVAGHPVEVGHQFLQDVLPARLKQFNARRESTGPMPWLAALICTAAFDLALHDAYGMLHQRPTYETYNARFMSADLAHYLTPAEGSRVSFDGKYPEDFLVQPRPNRLLAWHLVGGKDPLDQSELDGSEPSDGHPVLLRDWIQRDGLQCLKIKLRGNDARWDYERTVKVGRIASASGVDWLSTDFNCTVTDPAYVNDILDRLLREHPRIHGMVLYVEQPFPYDLEANQIDVHSVSARKPLFMDESAHEWHLVRLGRTLGWSGVALKTCKTQTGALLSLCWAKAHGMPLMVQDSTNPMLAQVSHLQLAAHAGTLMGVETNAMQFYPDASAREAKVHPEIYRRRNGVVDLHTIRGPGLGYRIDEMTVST